jgi:hypothetical protein
MAPPGGVAQQIAGTGIFQGEHTAGDPKPFIPQGLPLDKKVRVQNY